MQKTKNNYGKQLSLNEIKDIELNILIAVDKICTSLDLRYSLAGGTLLGAIRHKGFIPWDDDIDILMPRSDYVKFVSYCLNNNLEFYKIYNNLSNKTCPFPFTKIFDSRTVLIDRELNIEPFFLGVYIDVFPVDYLGDDIILINKKYDKNLFLRKLLSSKTWRRYKRNKNKSAFLEPVRFIFFILSRFFSSRFLIKSIEKINSQNYGTKFSGCYVGMYENKEFLPTDIFSTYIRRDFENHKFMCLANYDLYLSSLYGDYLVLPPLEKRISHHTFEAFSKDM